MFCSNLCEWLLILLIYEQYGYALGTITLLNILTIVKAQRAVISYKFIVIRKFTYIYMIVANRPQNLPRRTQWRITEIRRPMRSAILVDECARSSSCT